MFVFVFVKKMMQSSDFVSKAGALIMRAQEEESRNALPKALCYYEQALTILSNILQNKQNKFISERISGYAAKCLAKAEEIKELIQSGGSLPETTNQVYAKTPLSQKPQNDEKVKMHQDLAMNRVDPNDINVSWDDVVGMSDIKILLDDAIELPRDMPQLFTGNRKPTRSLLLYGPPGTGKTLVGKAVACTSHMAFYSVTSAELISKFVGESEKYVKSLFEMVKQDKPCVLFLDEIEALCCQRKETTHTNTVQQFLVQLDGISKSGSMEGVLLIGCTNKPWDLDEAMIRRLEKRVYIRLPTCDEREALIRFYIIKNKHCIEDSQFKEIARQTEYFSSADIMQLAKTAAMIPLNMIRCATYFALLEDGTLMPCERSHPLGIPMTYTELKSEKLNVIEPPIVYEHLLKALESTKSTVDVTNLKQYTEWTKKYGQ